MEQISIVKLIPKDWQEYKKLRLEALQTDPEAFAKTYSQAAQSSDEKWKELLESHLCLFAKDGEHFIGMIAIELNKSEKIRHRGEIHQVYVKKEWRNKGVGKQLMTALFEELKKLSEFKKIVLYVSQTQLSAQALYKSLGFKMVGTLERDIKIADQFYDVYVMEKFL